uniref:Uncharacterized protein n=1 Tax=Caenorhabditis tropicalis TaxID=1561998 RepID=A0A1I7TGP5_9PELO
MNSIQNAANRRLVNKARRKVFQIRGNVIFEQFLKESGLDSGVLDLCCFQDLVHHLNPAAKLPEVEETNKEPGVPSLQTHLPTEVTTVTKSKNKRKPYTRSKKKPEKPRETPTRKSPRIRKVTFEEPVEKPIPETPQKSSSLRNYLLNNEHVHITSDDERELAAILRKPNRPRSKSLRPRVTRSTQMARKNQERPFQTPIRKSNNRESRLSQVLSPPICYSSPPEPSYQGSSEYQETGSAEGRERICRESVLARIQRKKEEIEKREDDMEKKRGLKTPKVEPIW